jgi:hypothetical protein
MDNRAVDRHAAGGDPVLGFAARGEPGARDRLGNAFLGKACLGDALSASAMLGQASAAVMMGAVIDHRLRATFTG